MPDPRLTVVCHFRNEEVYLDYWLRHYYPLFDHGVLLDYGSTDGSADLVRRLAPGWEVRPSRNEWFDSAAVDAEVMAVEREFAGWKMCLNVTEFVLHHDLRAYVRDLQARHPHADGAVTTGFIIQDAPDQMDVPLDPSCDLWDQRHFGCPEPDPGDGGSVLRRRLLHRAPDGRYGPGRHSNGVSGLDDPPLYLFWYGWCPLALKKVRNRSAGPMVPAHDRARGWSTHHTLGGDAVTNVWREKYLPHCRDLLAGTWPQLSAAVDALRAARGRAAGTA